MLNYLVDSTEQLMSMMLMVGLLVSYVHTAYGTSLTRRVMWIGTGVGVLAAAVMTYMKTATSLVDTGIWNLRIFSATLLALIAFVVFCLLGKKKKRLGEYGVSIALAAEAALVILYYLPFYLEMPNSILLASGSILSDDTLLNSDFLLKIICWLGGFVLTFVAGLAAEKVGQALGKGKALLFMSITLFINLLKILGTAFGILLAKRIISTNHILFLLSKYTSNNSNWFVYATMAAVLAAAIVLIVRSMHVNEPYANQAEHRKIKAKWRRFRRWSITVIVCIVLAVLIMTVIYAVANRDVELSPIEDCEIRDGALYIPFEQVNDGHLHRFGYTTENDVTIRLIVIQKPNSSAYGVGLDACDICGETGYYEKDGQVVCNLCDVVMNINTIGFKGGCNPIVIDYSIQNGYIIVPIEGLLEYESEFK